MINVTKADLPNLEIFGEYLNIGNILVVTNGTIALQMALRLLKIKGEVITTPFTFIATTNSIISENLTPIFADIDRDTLNLSPDEARSKITLNTKAILPVHIFGNPCDVEKFEYITKKHNIKLIYDASHAFGVEFDNKSILNYGDISTLSFHATKVFNTIEGGALIIKDKEIYERAKLYRNHGIKSEKEILLSGTNAKLDEIRAAIGICNLDNVDLNIRYRNNIYNLYKENLDSSKVKFQRIVTDNYNYSYMPILLNDINSRDNVCSVLLSKNVNPRKYFYPLISNLDFIKCLDKFEIAQNISDRILCLPIYPDLSELEVKLISKNVNKVKI